MKLKSAVNRVNSPMPDVADWDGHTLADLLEPERIAEGKFQCVTHESNLNGIAFGGQLLGQALQVAQRHCPELMPASLNVLFVEGAAVHLPIDYKITSIQVGRRFARYRVRATQGRRIVLDAHASFQADMSGFEHASGIPPSIPMPESLLSLDMLVDDQGYDWGQHQKSCLELRLVDPDLGLRAPSKHTERAFWVKIRNPLPHDTSLHNSALAYLSDYWINCGAMTRQVALTDAAKGIFAVSLNHSLWFHDECIADDWLLFVSHCPAMQRARGLSMASVYQRDGRLVASMAQDCLMLKRD